MHILAYSCLLAALVCSLGGGGAALLQLWQKGSELLELIRRAQYVLCALLLLASALLLHVLFWQDYRFEYVASYTDSFLPVFYRLTAFWAGQPGSFLFWALSMSVCGALFATGSARKTLGARTSLWLWAFFNSIMAFFCLVLVCWSNPFLLLEPAPVDGSGLNPLLQNPGMIFHPPLLFMGYAAFAIPGCLALAARMSGASEDWARISRPFIIFGWTLLTAGIVLGAWWAYMELGWGGYWGWDPVENASLLPWLMATAALHAGAIQAHGGKLARTSACLMALSLSAAFFATYLTRSGVIQSVHAFGDGGVGTPLLIFTAAATLTAFLVPFSGRSPGAPLASPLSREGALALACWLFVALALIIAIATMWPVFTAIAGSAPRGLEASFYNRVCMPLATLLLTLLCACGWLGWTGGLAGQRAGARLTAVCGAFAASLAAIWISGYRQPMPLIAASAGIAALCAIAMHCLKRAAWQNRRATSALGAHFGLAILAIGVAFSGPYTVERDLLLSRGQKETVGPYTVSLEEQRDGEGPGYDYLRAVLNIRLGAEEIGRLEPERRIYAKFGSMQFSEVDVISTLGEDIYASLLGMDEDYRMLVRISLEPLVNWIWVGGALMCLLPLLGIWRRGSRKAA